MSSHKAQAIDEKKHNRPVENAVEKPVEKSVTAPIAGQAKPLTGPTSVSAIAYPDPRASVDTMMKQVQSETSAKSSTHVLVRSIAGHIIELKQSPQALQAFADELLQSAPTLSDAVASIAA